MLTKPPHALTVWLMANPKKNALSIHQTPQKARLLAKRIFEEISFFIPGDVKLNLTTLKLTIYGEGHIQFTTLEPNLPLRHCGTHDLHLYDEIGVITDEMLAKLGARTKRIDA